MACVLRFCAARPKHEDNYYEEEEPDFGRDEPSAGLGASDGRQHRASTVSLVPPWTTGRLVVEVLGAKGLAAVDENGFSDPFVTVRLATPGSGASLPEPHDKLHRTATVMECLNPRYKQERFVFDDLRSPLPDVRFEVYDYSPGLFGEKAEPLGQCVLSLANHWKQTGGDVVDGPSRAEWHTLEPLVLGRRSKANQTSRSDCGELEVRVTLRRGTGDMQEDAVAEADAARWFVDESSNSGDGELRHAEHAANTLQVAVVRAINLIAADSALFGGKSDPFVTLSVGSFKCKSRVVRKNLNPVWMQTFDVPFQWDGGVPPALNVLVEDWDFGSSPDFLGKCQVQPISLPKCAPDGAAPATWYTLEGDDDDDDGGDAVDRGQVQLAIKMVYDPANDPSEDRPFFDEPIDEKSAAKLPNELRVAICRATGVKLSRVVGPYVVCRAAGRPDRKTKTRLATLSPVWNEVLTYDLHSEDLSQTGKSLKDAKIELVMWDWDRLDSDDFMGKVAIPWRPSPRPRRRNGLVQARGRQGRGRRRRRRGRRVLGQVLVVVQWRYNPALDFAPLEEADDGGLAHPANELRVALYRGRGLAIKDKNMFSEGGSSDPRVIFRVMDGTQELAKWLSGTRTKTLDPVWRETYAKELRADKVNATSSDLVLRCMCEDVDLTSTDYMGQFDVRLDAVLKDRPKVTGGWHALQAGETTFSQGTSAGDITGEIQLSLQWRFNPALDFDPWVGDASDVASRPPNELRVALIRAISTRARPASSRPRRRTLRALLADGRRRGRALAVHDEEAHARAELVRDLVFAVGREPTGDEVLEVCVEDDSLASQRETDLGHVSVAVGAFALKHGRDRAWHALTPPAGRRVGESGPGAVELVVSWVHSAAHDFDPWEHGHAANSTMTLPNELRLGLVAGRDVGVGDPKVVFHVDGAADGPLDFSSRASRGTHPVWCEAFALPMTMGEEAPSLVATLDDGTVKKRAVVPLDALGDGVKRKRAWHKLRLEGHKSDEEKETDGALQLMMHWIYNPALAFAPFGPEPAAAVKPPNTLRVGLAQGRGLARRPADAYVRGKALRLRVRFAVTGTDAVAASTTRDAPGFSPAWCETFDLAYAAKAPSTSPTKKDLAPLVQLECTVEGFGSGDAAAPVGYAKIPIDDLRANTGAPSRKWYALVQDGDGPAGELDLVLQWRYQPHADPWHEPAAARPTGAAARALLPKRDDLVAFELHTDEVEMSIVEKEASSAAPFAF
ncbi:C2 domain-containing protein [Aureococcus anophagefferens]|nr:C2 domain-containing protein [Aureococcus anophagefferens]